MMMIKEPKRWLAIATLVLLTSVFAAAQHRRGLDPAAVDAVAEGTAGATIASSRNLVSLSRMVVLPLDIFLLSVPQAWEQYSSALALANPASRSEKRK